MGAGCVGVWGDVARLIVALGLVFMAGCATGELPGQPGQTTTGKCTNSTECAEDEVCNLVTGMCRKLGVVPDMPPKVDMTVADMPADMTVADMPADMSGACNPACEASEDCVAGQCVPRVIVCDPPCDAATQECKQGTCVSKQMTGCDPACGETEVCQNNACVPAQCNPACEAPGICTAQGCKYPACASEGDRCDLNATPAAGLRCLFVRSTGEARCFRSCSETYSAIGCKTAQYCLPIDPDTPASGAICQDSQCTQSSDCTSGTTQGTCITVENQFGFCERAGTASVGQACDLSSSVPSERCEQGASCRTSNGASTGTCVRVCNPWASGATGCAASERCALLTPGTGRCTNQLDSSGQQVYDTCQISGTWCANATQCFANGAQNVCFRYCRPGIASDCADLGTAACDPYVFTGDKSIGLCNPDCSLNTSICGTTRVCVGKTCRPRCTPATRVTDCCDDETPCDFQCLSDNSGGYYCE